MPIARSKNDRTKMAVDKDGKNAVTHFKVLERFKDFTYIEVNIETGRTHQIRVHFSHLASPLIGDKLYGNDDNMDLGLQCYYLKFINPITKKEIEIELS